MIGIMRPNGDVINISVITSYGLDYRNTVTSHAVENGTKIADHVQAENLQIGLRGVIVEADITGYTGVYSTSDLIEQNKEFRVVASGNTASVVQGGQAVKEALLAARNNKELLTVLEGLPTTIGGNVPLKNNTSFFQNCVITSLSFNEDGDTGDAVEVQLSLEQIRIVKLREVVVNAPKQTTGKGTAGKNKGNKKEDGSGNKTPATNTPAQAAKKQEKGKSAATKIKELGTKALEYLAN